jgi:hypothetical protein
MTMMQPCASAAKLRGGETILWNGERQEPPRYTATSDHGRTFIMGENADTVSICFPPLRSVCGTQDDAFWDFTIRRVAP